MERHFMSALSAVCWLGAVYALFSIYFPYFFFPPRRIIKLTSFEMSFLRGNNHYSVTLGRWINVKMFVGLISSCK